MGDDYWQTTAQMFGSLFEKPKMTEKLLTKPPFKYLFDVVIQTINSTGFAKNLYTKDELSADFYDTKEKKMYFLRKISMLVGAMLKEEIEAKPNKIVAGVEPDKTNLLLQALYRAAVSGEDSGPLTKKILAKLAKEETEAQGQGQGDEEAKHQEEAPPQEKPKEKKAAPKEERTEKSKEPAPKAKEEKPTKTRAEEPKPQEKSKEPERPPATEKLQRPGTASKRPPPEKSNVQVVDDSHKKTSGPSGIIREDHSKKDEDDNLFESQPQEKSKISKVDAAGHGQFVQEALKDVQQQEEAAQKDEQAQGKIKMRKIGDKSKPKTQAAAAGEAKLGTTGPTADSAVTAAGTSQGEVEVIQKLIQSLTQNINPLRKSVDFINDDIESMNKEMEYWRSQYLNSKAKHQLELMGTEEQLQPLQNKLAELEEQIKDKKFKIQAAKSSILQNEQKIQKLLYSVVSNK